MATPVSTSCPVNGAEVPENKSNHGRTYCGGRCKKAENDLASLERSAPAVEWAPGEERRRFQSRLRALANKLGTDQKRKAGRFCR